MAGCKRLSAKHRDETAFQQITTKDMGSHSLDSQQRRTITTEDDGQMTHVIIVRRQGILSETVRR